MFLLFLMSLAKVLIYPFIQQIFIEDKLFQPLETRWKIKREALGDKGRNKQENK